MEVEASRRMTAACSFATFGDKKWLQGTSWLGRAVTADVAVLSLSLATMVANLEETVTSRAACEVKINK